MGNHQARNESAVKGVGYLIFSAHRGLLQWSLSYRPVFERQQNCWSLAVGSALCALLVASHARGSSLSSARNSRSPFAEEDPSRPDRDS